MSQDMVQARTGSSLLSLSVGTLPAVKAGMMLDANPFASQLALMTGTDAAMGGGVSVGVGASGTADAAFALALAQVDATAGAAPQTLPLAKAAPVAPEAVALTDMPALPDDASPHQIIEAVLGTAPDTQTLAPDAATVAAPATSATIRTLPQASPDAVTTDETAADVAPARPRRATKPDAPVANAAYAAPVAAPMIEPAAPAPVRPHTNAPDNGNVRTALNATPARASVEMPQPAAVSANTPANVPDNAAAITPDVAPKASAAVAPSALTPVSATQGRNGLTKAAAQLEGGAPVQQITAPQTPGEGRTAAPAAAIPAVTPATPGAAPEVTAAIRAETTVHAEGALAQAPQAQTPQGYFAGPQTVVTSAQSGLVAAAPAAPPAAGPSAPADPVQTVAVAAAAAEPVSAQPQSAQPQSTGPMPAEPAPAQNAAAVVASTLVQPGQTAAPRTTVTTPRGVASTITPRALQAAVQSARPAQALGALFDLGDAAAQPLSEPMSQPMSQLLGSDAIAAMPAETIPPSWAAALNAVVAPSAANAAFGLAAPAASANAQATPMETLAFDAGFIGNVETQIARVAGGGQMVRMQIMPEHLGRIDIEMLAGPERDHVRIVTEHDAVRDTLVQSQVRLEQDLRNNGQRSADVTVELRQQSPGTSANLGGGAAQQQRGQSGQEGTSGRDGLSRQTAADAATDAQSAPRRPRGNVRYA
jgi:hypothetical protein